MEVSSDLERIVLKQIFFNSQAPLEWGHWTLKMIARGVLVDLFVAPGSLCRLPFLLERLFSKNCRRRVCSLTGCP